MSLIGDFNEDSYQIMLQLTLDEAASAANLKQGVANVAQQISTVDLTNMFRGADTATNQVVNDFRNVSQSTQDVVGNFRNLQTTSEETTTESAGFFSNLGQTVSQVFSNMGGSGSGFLGVMMGVFGGGELITAVNAFIQLIGQLAQAFGQMVSQGVQDAMQLQTSYMNLEVGIRALQREGADVSMKDITDKMDEISQKWGVFTQQELAQGAAVFVNNMREMGGSITDMTNLMDIAATQSVMTGQTFEHEATILNQAIVAGYSRTLNTQDLGLDFSQKLLDNEAQILGYNDKTFASLTVQERTQVVIALLTKEQAQSAGDVTHELQSSNNEQLKAQQTLAQTATVLGDELLPMWTDIKIAGADIAIAFLKILQVVMAVVATLATGVQLTYDLISGQGIDKMEQDLKTLGDTWNEVINNKVNPDKNPLGDATDTGSSTISDQADQATSDLATNEKTREKDAETYAQDMEDIETSLERNLEDDATNHAQKMEDIQTKNQQAIEDAGTTFTNDMADIDKNYNEKREADYQKNADQIAKDESDLQTKLNELKEKALYDVSEDVRTGDASAARQVLRQYQFDRQQAIENGQKTSDDRQTAFQQELADLDTQEAQEKAKREEDYKQKLLDLQTQLAREKEAEDLAYARKIADDQLKATRDRADKLTKYNQDLADLAAEESAEVAVVQKANDAKMASDDAVTANKAANLKQQAAMSGNGGVGSSNLHTEQLADAMRAKGYAQGGSFIANSPTAAIFGEGGQPERVTITPLSVGRSNLTATGDGAGGAGGKLALEILLSENLIANIVENTLGEVSTAIETARRVS
jgi:hypothetical protein